MFEELHALLDKVCGAEPEAFSDGDSIIELHRCLARLEAATTRVTASFEAGGEWEADGARSVAAWLARRCGLPKANASRRVRLGRDLRHLPAAEDAWLASDIGVAQVAALAGARTPVTEEAMARDEAGRRHRGGPRHAGRVAGHGLDRAGGVRHTLAGDRRGRHPAVVHWRPAQGHRGPRPGSASTSSATCPPGAARSTTSRPMPPAVAPMNGTGEWPVGTKPETAPNTGPAASGMRQAAFPGSRTSAES